MPLHLIFLAVYVREELLFVLIVEQIKNISVVTIISYSL